MASLANYPIPYCPDEPTDNITTSVALRTVDCNTSTLEATIQNSDDKMSNLIRVLADTRRRFDASVGSDRILEHQYRVTLSFLKNHLRVCLHSTSNNPDPLYLGECDSILEDIRDQRVQLRKIRDRIRRKELEFAQFSAANWKAVSSQHLQRDRTMLVLSVQQFELP